MWTQTARMSSQSLLALQHLARCVLPVAQSPISELLST